MILANMLVTGRADAALQRMPRPPGLKRELSSSIEQAEEKLRSDVEQRYEEYCADKGARNAAAFQVVDTDGDGKLSQDELVAAVQGEAKTHQNTAKPTSSSAWPATPSARLETISAFRAPSGDDPSLHSVSRRIASLVAPGGGRPEVDFAECMLQSMRREALMDESRPHP